MDVVLLDLAIAGGGVEACAVLRRTRPQVRVVVMADGRIKGVLSASEASQESIMRLATHSGEVITHTTEKAGR